MTLAVAIPSGQAEARNAWWRHVSSRTAIYAFLTVFALLYLLPLFVVIANSFRPLPEITQNGLIWWPRSLRLGAWSEAWSTMCVAGTCAGVQRNFYNSLLMTVPATAISTLLGALNGYILAKWRFRGSEALFACMTLGVFMPPQIALLPWAYILGKLSLTNSVAGLILIHVVQGLSFATLFCRNYYVAIPDDLIKAARIDGAGFWRIFRRIILPLSPPILIVTVIWQFTGIWNEFLFGVSFTTGDQQPVTAALIALSAAITSELMFGDQSAAVLIAALPTLLVYLFGGRYFLRGLTAGAVK